VGNEDAKRILHEQGFENPVRVLPQLGIDLFEGVKPRERTSKWFKIGYAGRITEEKGVLDLVEAAAAMHDRENVVLYFVGAGDALGDVKRLAVVRDVRLEHHPAVRNEELHSHLAKMDVLVLPSRSTVDWVEQFGHILLEAMAAGVPVVGSSSGEIPNVIGDAGIVFPEQNISELSNALEKLSRDEAARLELASRAISRIRDRFTHDMIAQKQIEFYKTLLGRERFAESREVMAVI
jgi:glycosyltransferase involved in cell wall biosynthesis